MVRTPPIGIQPIHGRWVIGQGFQRVWFGSREKKVVYSWVPAQASLGEMSCWDDISPKRGKYELESVGAFYRGRREAQPFSRYECQGM